MLNNLQNMVVKAVGESGGYGMLIGPHSTAQQREEFRAHVLADPRNYIAQPTLALSCAPCLIDGSVSRATSISVPTFLWAKKSRWFPAASLALRSGKVRLSSTPRKEAAAKTPGCFATATSARNCSKRCPRS